ncbi:MAG: glycoside hydrolase family 2 protein [Bacteroidota bacterium]
MLNEKTFESSTRETGFSVTSLSSGWRFRQVGTEEWRAASVPGCNFTDLLENGLIEDPFDRTNEEALQWIEKEDWEYELVFVVSSEQLAFRQALLLFEGLDTFADIELNGHPVLQANNMFRSWQCEVRELLVEGVNRLRIVFHSPLKYVIENEEIADFLYPAGNDHSEENLSVYIRKAPYHFGWDWGPRFVTSGIWRPIRLEYHDYARIEDIRVNYDLTDQKATIDFEIEISSLYEGRAEIKLTSPISDISFPVTQVELKEGKTAVQCTFDIEDYQLWWPKCMGDPHLYLFEIQLLVNGEIASSHQQRVGLRKIEVVNEKDKDGESFFFKVNGLPLFMKGANYIPQDSFLDRVGPDRYEQLIDDALDANFNMLRVWGGGIYEDDRFYDLADEKGLLIWQDFMFACTMYPSHLTFLQNVEQEAIQNIKRLRNHPSLALWCGNNEIHMGWHNWGWQEEFGYDETTQEELWSGYLELFERRLPSLVQEHDPNSFYFPSSPISNWEADIDFTIGDNHYWGVWHGEAPFSEYKERIPRFMSEYGFQSFPLFQSVQQYTSPPDWYLTSDVMLLHQKHPRGNELIRKYLLSGYKKPKDFESFLYGSQVLQAEGISLAIESHRRHKPYCMGTLYWQMNDCWPVASWSSIDYYGQWKALHYAARKLYNDLLVSCDIDDKEVRVHAINDAHEPKSVAYQFEVFDFQGRKPFSYTGEIVLEANASLLCHTFTIAECLRAQDKRNVVAIASLIGEGGQILSRTHYLFTNPKDLRLRIPSFTSQVTSKEDHFSVRLSTDTFAKSIYLEFEGHRGNFSDNFFDLLPGEEKVVTFPKPTDMPKKTPKLLIKSLRDTYL